MRRFAATVLLLLCVVAAHPALANFSGLYVGQYGNPISGLWIATVDTTGQLRGLGFNNSDSIGFTITGSMDLQSGQAAATGTNGSIIAFSVADNGVLTGGSFGLSGATVPFLGEITSAVNPREPSTYANVTTASLDSRLVGFAGNFRGTYSGGASGSIVVQANAQGVVDGMVLNTSTGRGALVDGTVSTAGAISFRTNNGDAFTGTVTETGSITGTWQSGSLSGSFVATQVQSPQWSFYQDPGSQQFSSVTVGSLYGSYGYGPAMVGASRRNSYTLRTPLVRCAATVSQGSSAVFVLRAKGLADAVGDLGLVQRNEAKDTVSVMAYQASGRLGGAGQWYLTDSQGRVMQQSDTLDPAKAYTVYYTVQEGVSAWDNNATAGTLETSVFLAKIPVADQGTTPSTSSSSGGGGGGGGCTIDPRTGAVGVGLGLEWLLLAGGLALLAWRGRNKK